MKLALQSAIVLTMILPIATTSAFAEGVPVLYADLSLQFECKPYRDVDLEPAIEHFLEKNGFTSLNQGRLQRRHGVYLAELRVIGLDNSGRMIDVIALPHAEGRYALRLNTPPPTKRDSGFERALENFVVQDVHCVIRQASRNENPAATKELHQSEVDRVRRLFLEAETLEGRQRL